MLMGECEVDEAGELFVNRSGTEARRSIRLLQPTVKKFFGGYESGFA